MKTYASGFINSTLTVTQSVPGTIYSDQLALTPNRAVWIAMIVLVIVVLMSLLAALLFSDGDRVPFDLEHILSRQSVPCTVKTELLAIKGSSLYG